MRQLLLLTLATGCGDVTINVGDEGDTGTRPDSGDTAGETGDPDTGDTDTGRDTDTGSGWTGGGAWGLGAITEIASSGGIIRGAWLRDANDDGHLDLLLDVSDYSGGEDTREQAIVYPGDGAGHFGSPIITVGAGYDTNVAAPDLGDLDGDGHPDLLTRIAGGYGVFFGNGHGFGAQVPITRPGWTYVTDARVADVDGDGNDDVVTAGCCDSGSLTLSLERWDGSTMSAYATFPLASSGAGYQTSIADAPSVTADGVTFTALPGAYEDVGGALATWTILAFDDGTGMKYQVGDAGWRYSWDLWWAGVPADVDGDGVSELLTLGYDGLQVGPADRADRPTVVSSATNERNGYQLAAFDMNDDGHPDSIEELGLYHSNTERTGMALGIALGNGTSLDAESTYELPFAAWGSTYPQLAVGDVAEDGCGDVVVVTGDMNDTVQLVLGACGE